MSKKLLFGMGLVVALCMVALAGLNMTPTSNHDRYEATIHNPCGNDTYLGSRTTSWGQQQVVCKGNATGPYNKDVQY